MKSEFVDFEKELKILSLGLFFTLRSKEIPFLQDKDKNKIEPNEKGTFSIKIKDHNGNIVQEVDHNSPDAKEVFKPFQTEIYNTFRRKATETDFDELFERELNKRNWKDNNRERLRKALKYEVKTMISDYKNHFKSEDNVSGLYSDPDLLDLAERFLEWLKDPENFKAKLELRDSAVEQIALLRMSGFIDAYKEKYPEVKDWHIAQLLSKILGNSAHLISQYLTEDINNEKHPFNPEKSNTEERKKKISKFLDSSKLPKRDY